MASARDYKSSKKFNVQPVKNAAMSCKLPLEDAAVSCASTTKTLLDDFIESSPAVLETSRVEGLHVKSRRKERSHSWPPSESETASIVSDSQSNGPVAEQVEESDTNDHDTAIDSCKNSIIKFRNSAFIFIVQLVFSLIPVSAIIMGLLFAENCPKVHFLPVFGAVIGLIGAIFMAIWMVVVCYNRHGTPCSNKQGFLFGVLCFVFLVLTIVDAVFVVTLSPSFDPTSTDYCNETFYNYAFYKEIATAVAIVLSAIIYLPGSRHILCCHNCSMRSTPSAFYVSI